MAATPYRGSIEFAAKKYGLDPDLVEAVVIQESSGRADAFRFEPGFYEQYLKGKAEYAGQIRRRISSSYGLMQVMFTTAQQYGYPYEPEMLFLPGTNLDYGCRHLAALFDWAKGDGVKALAAYNGGKGNWTAIRPQEYAHEVLDRVAALKEAA